MEHDPSQISTTFEMIDAETAGLYRSFNRPHQAGVKGTNRKASEAESDRWAASMLRNEWEPIHQGIAFTAPDPQTGEIELIDGQNRLAAVQKAARIRPDIKVPFMVTRGLSKHSQQVMDIGRKRRLGDFLAMDGYANYSNLSAGLRLIQLYLNVPYEAVAWSRYKPTPGEQRAIMSEYGDEANYSYRMISPLVKMIPPSGIHATAFLARQAGFKDELKEFLAPLRFGEGLKLRSDPRLLFRNWHINAVRDRMQRPQITCFALALKAFNAFVSGDNTIKSLSFSAKRGDAFPYLVKPQDVDKAVDL